MSDQSDATAPTRRKSLMGWPARLIASRSFQRWAARNPLTRGKVKREGEALFDLLAGFCHSQVLMALVQMDIPDRLLVGPMSVQDLAQVTGTPEDRMLILLRAAVAIGLIKANRKGVCRLTQTGAALAGVPGLKEMIKHHEVLYRDLSKPDAFFRGETTPELAAFWPYVFGGAMDPDVAATYSDLMAESQALVAEDTLRTVSFKGVARLMDVGGGSGAFLAEVGKAYPRLGLQLFDLPEVAPSAQARFDKLGMGDRLTIRPGSFKIEAIPAGADAMSLIRVLYDHSDDTVKMLLRHCYSALPEGGRLIISEPMLGDKRPTRPGDAYFAIYTLAMETGKTRSAAQIAALCREAGFEKVRILKSPRPYVTSCLDVRKI